jgi:thiamine-monophosphate kinase
MKISDLGEFGLIKKIKEQSKGRSPATLIGIGDDAAALSLSPSKKLLATTDMLLEGVHFDLSYTDLYSLGWKSAAVNLSDIAAMGGVPRFCLTALGIPSTISVEQIKEFYKGFNALCRKYNVYLVGGDTCRSEKGLVVSVTALGEVEKSKMLTRAGAQPGDLIFVTGTLGDSAAGMELLKAGYRGQGTGLSSKGYKSEIRNPQSEITRLIKKHLQPMPRVGLGRMIALSGCATSMIDISDGLSSDLGHICEESGVGAEIGAEQIPFSKDFSKTAGQQNAASLHYALSGGEDYELLFTVPPSKLKKFLSLKIASMQIGAIIAGKKMFLSDDGKRTLLKPKGFNHFAG